MHNKSFKIPILLVVFNRPDLLERVLLQIGKVKPLQLFVSCDGPRNDRDKIEIDKIKEILKTKVNWECSIHTNFFPTNLRSFNAVPKAISWFFDHVNKGIILEDDCVPDVSFFAYMDHVLNLFENTPEVLSVSGNNFQNGHIYGDGSFFLSRYFHVWGWGTWKRAWAKFDISMTNFPKFKESGIIKEYISNERARNRILKIMERAYNGGNIWDYKWQFCHMYYGGYTVKPQVNLITNIGFDHRATHIDTNPLLENLVTGSIDTILIPSSKLPYYKEADDYLSNTLLQPPPFQRQIRKALKLVLATLRNKVGV